MEDVEEMILGVSRYGIRHSLFEAQGTKYINILIQNADPLHAVATQTFLQSLTVF
jgi:hypothetical protein